MVTYIYYKNFYKHLQILTLICGYATCIRAINREILVPFPCTSDKNVLNFCEVHAQEIGLLMSILHGTPHQQ